MIDTQQQYSKLNICGEISIIVVQALRQEKRYAHKLTHIYTLYEGGGDEREHIHIHQVIHHQSARDTLSRC
jgi:hypothetical protein